MIELTQILMREHPDYYSLLHVSKQATQGEIKKSFRRLARQFHPDFNPNNPFAEQRFKQICDAYQVLNNPQSRALYDQGFELPNESEPTEKNAHGPAFHAIYLQGMNKLVQRNYEGAIADFNAALALQPQSVEAYLGRCQAHDALKDDRAVFEDCHQILQLNPKIAQAYYYQGCARLRLGYRQGAIDAYSEAITQDQKYALAYFRRGQIKLDLNKSDQARQDLQTAAAMFQGRGDSIHYQQVNALLNRIKDSGLQTPQNSVLGIIRTFLAIALKKLPGILFNPGGNLLSIYIKLKPQRAFWAGILYFYIAMASGLVCERLYTWTNGSQASPKFVMASVVFFVTLAFGSFFVRLLSTGRGHWTGDVLLAGVVLLPLSSVALLNSLWILVGGFGSIILIAITFASCYSILILYIGCTQLSNLSEPLAMFVVPILLMVSAQAAGFVL